MSSSWAAHPWPRRVTLWSLVTVTGAGWPDDGWVSGVEVLQCPADAFDAFDCFPAEQTTVGPAGAVEAVPLPETADEAREEMAFETTLEVHTVLDLEFGGRVDCRMEDCIVLAEDFGGDRSARAPISFLVDQGPITASRADRSDQRRWWPSARRPRVEALLGSATLRVDITTNSEKGGRHRKTSEKTCRSILRPVIYEQMFPTGSAAIEKDLRAFCRTLRPEQLTSTEAKGEIETMARLERLASGARVRLAKRLEDTVPSEEGDKDAAEWLANATGQSPTDAAKDLEASKALDDLAATDEALRDGELSPAQAREITAAAGADPDAEAGLLETARHASVPELRREAKKVKAAATDAKTKDDEAHRNRKLDSGTDDDTAEGWIHATGPAARIAEFMAILAPWVQAEYDKARRQGRRDGSAAYRFDALMAMARWAAQQLKGGGQKPAAGFANTNVGPAGPPATILARLDITAAMRGHATAGETCEIDGLGPVPVETLLEFLPQAAIDLIITNGMDVFNVTHLGRRANARQQVVLDWFGGQCTRQGCTNTRNLQVDHRIDWATIKITELRNLDWLCTEDHRRKTHQGWALVSGTGRRRMVPPDHPDHPAHGPPPASGDPPGQHQAA